MPPGTEQKARLQISCDHPPRAFFTFQSWPLRAWSGMTGVVNSLKLPYKLGIMDDPACITSGGHHTDSPCGTSTGKRACSVRGNHHIGFHDVSRRRVCGVSELEIHASVSRTARVTSMGDDWAFQKKTALHLCGEPGAARPSSCDSLH